MKYDVGDSVEVRCNDKAPWFGGIIDSIDNDNYVVKLTDAQLLSMLHNKKFRRDLKTDIVSVNKHLETIGLGYLHLRLKNSKMHKPK